MQSSPEKETANQAINTKWEELHKFCNEKTIVICDT